MRQPPLVDEVGQPHLHVQRSEVVSVASFDNMDSATVRDCCYTPGDDSSDPVVGLHEVVIIGYAEQGVRVENSRDDGFVNLSLNFIYSSEIGDLNVVKDLESWPPIVCQEDLTFAKPHVYCAGPQR